MDDFLWTEIFRPKTIEQTILPKGIKNIFGGYIKQGDIPNLLLVGKAGVGKTTVAKALCNELEFDSIVINASLHGNIDTLRTDILQFVTSVSFLLKKKCVILDEADHLNPNSTQPALRNFMDEFSSKSAFIFTANWKNKIVDPLRSRLSEITFNIPNDEKSDIAKQMLKRLKEILEFEHVKADHAILVEAVKTYFPDFRKMLSELQAHVVDKKISPTIFLDKSQYNFEELITNMKGRNFTEVRKIIGTNNIPSEVFFSYFYKKGGKFLKPQSVPQMILIISKYQFQDTFVLDKEINLVACCAELMADCIFL